MKKFISLILCFATLFSVACMGVNVTAASPYSVAVTTGKYFTVKNLGSGKMLNVYGSKSASNTNVTVYEKDNTKGQNFKFEKSGSSYILIPQCATKCALNVYGTKAKNNANVNIWTKSGNDTQSWVIEYNSSLSGYIIRSANNKNYVLAATGTKNSSNVCIEKYDSSDKFQVWTSDAFKVVVNRETTTKKAVVETTKQTETTTEKSEIKKINYLQSDSRWRYLRYNESYLQASGCGILSIVNAVYNCTGNFIEPKKVADWAYEKNYFNQSKNGGGGICNNNVFSKAAEKFGKEYEFKFVKGGSGSKYTVSSKDLKEHLANGGTAIVHVPGHYMCLVDYNADSGKFLVFDPAPGTGSNYNSIKRRNLTKASGDWKTEKELSTGNIKIDGFWLYKKA